MAKQRVIKTTFRSDTFVEGLDPIEKLLFAYLLTNEALELCWVYELSTKRMSFDTGISKAQIEEVIMPRFQKADKVHYHDWYVCIVNFTKNQSHNPSVKKWMQRSLDEIPHEILSKFASLSKTRTGCIQDGTLNLTLLNLTLPNLTLLDEEIEEPKSESKKIEKSKKSEKQEISDSINFWEKYHCTQDEYDKLIAEYWKSVVDDMIDDYDTYIINNKWWKNYKSPYRALRKWLKKKYEEWKIVKQTPVSTAPRQSYADFEAQQAITKSTRKIFNPMAT